MSGAIPSGRATHASHRARILGLGLSVGIAIAVAGCGDFSPQSVRQVECVSIATGLRLTDTDNHYPGAAKLGFYGTDPQGFTRYVPKSEVGAWKCRFAPARGSAS